MIAAALPLWRPAAPRPEGPVGRMPRYAWSDPVHAAARAPHRSGRSPALARRALRRLRRLEPPRRPRRRRARRAGVLGAQHDGDRARRGLLRRARRDRDGCRARAGTRARATGLRVLHAVPRRLPDRRADRAGRARRHALPVDHDAGARCGPGGARRRPRGSRVRLRHLPGRVPVEHGPCRPSSRSSPRIRGRGCRWPTGWSCPARSCSPGTRTSTCPTATRATCVATRSSRSATRRRAHRELAAPYADDADPLLRDAARRALTR